MGSWKDCQRVWFLPILLYHSLFFAYVDLFFHLIRDFQIFVSRCQLKFRVILFYDILEEKEELLMVNKTNAGKTTTKKVTTSTRNLMRLKHTEEH